MYLRDELVESGSKLLDYQRAPPLNLSYAHSPPLLVELPRPNGRELSCGGELLVPCSSLRGRFC